MKPDDLRERDTLSAATTFRAGPTVLSSRVGTDIVLLDDFQGKYFGLNELAATIFEQAVGGASLGDIHARLLAQYNVQHETLWADMRECILEMIALRLLIPGPDLLPPTSHSPG